MAHASFSLTQFLEDILQAPNNAVQFILTRRRGDELIYMTPKCPNKVGQILTWNSFYSAAQFISIPLITFLSRILRRK
jgi:hypothetical protein